MDGMTLRAGAARIKQMRTEIDEIISLLFSFLQRKDFDSLKAESSSYPIIICETTYVRWSIYQFSSGTNTYRPTAVCYRFTDDDEIEVYTFLANNMSLEDVAFVHGNLDSFINGMAKKLPKLRALCGPIIRAAQDAGPRIYYQLEFSIPAKTQIEIDTKDGRKNQIFRKESRLFEPLPIGTELFLAIEGEATLFKPGLGSIQIPDDGEAGEIFKIVRYEYSVIDSYGNLEEGPIIMQLEIADGHQVTNPETFVRLLESNGWDPRHS